MDKDGQEIVILLEINKQDTSPSFRSVRFPKPQIFVEMFPVEIYRAQYGNAMLVHIRCVPIWRPENNVNIWNLLWLSRRLIICTQETSICISTFPNALTSKKAINHEIGIYFSTNAIVAFCHAPP